LVLLLPHGYEGQGERFVQAAVDEGHDDEGGGDAWLATYGDMITLLMCFFVIFFGTSTNLC